MDPAPAPAADAAPLLSLDGWEGPLDLLLSLARGQRVDLRQLSVLDLVEQYLAVVADARARRLELAADWLVMAAWLAYLKSALLLPRAAEADPDPDELAAELRHRLARLEAMRDAADRLMARPRLGRDSWTRGAPEGLAVAVVPAWRTDLYELAAAYGAVRARTQPVVHRVCARAVVTLEEALDRLGRLLPQLGRWASLADLAAAPPALARSSLASAFAAALELARQGRVELAQEAPFAPLRLRRA